MTRRNQLQAVLEGKEPDGLGSIFWKHFGVDEKQGEAARRAHDQWISATDPVFVKVMNEALYPHSQEFTSAADWDSVEPYPTTHTLFTAQKELVADMVAAYRDTHHVLATVHGVTASAYHARGGGAEYEEKRGQLTAALRENEELVGAKFRTIGESLLAQVEELMALGIDGVFLAALGGEGSNFTDEEFARHIRPHDLAILEAVGRAGGIRYLHICKEDIVLDRYDGYPVEIVQVAEHLNGIALDELRTRFPGAVIVGGVDNMDPYFTTADGSAEELAAAAAASISDTARFIVGADCSLPDSTDPAIVGALSRAAQNTND